MGKDGMNVALLGLGTVGKGVYKVMKTQRPEMPQKLNTVLNLKKILVRHPEAHVKDVDDPSILTSDYSQIVDDPDIDIVIELIGGIEPACTYIRDALEAGKSVVTANKDLIAERGGELMEIAEENHAELRFEASVAGGIPIISPLKNSLSANEISEVMGIVNGTTNFILSKMTDEGMDYEQALREATALGYAEADPSADVSGLDALRKIRLAAAVAFGILPDGCLHEGIENVSAEDIRFYQSKDLVIRLIARTALTEKGVSAHVEPVLFARNAAEAAVSLNNNLAVYEGRFCGRIGLSGQGAGRYPTASAVIRDLENILSGARRMLPEKTVRAAADNGSEKYRCYLRLTEAFAGLFPGAERLEQSTADGSLRLLTKPLPADRMHAAAAEIRKKGGCISFAALEE